MAKRNKARMRRPDGPRYTRRPPAKPKQGERAPSGAQDVLQIIPLGGNEEVGRNCYLIQYGPNILVIDFGLQFPEDDMPGIDYIIPDTTYLRGKEKMIRGMIVTHGHYDHIGGFPHLSPEMQRVPIYGTNLTMAMIAKKVEDVTPGRKLNLHNITTKDHLKLGPFRLEFFGVSHNIPASIGIVVTTPAGSIVHTGDFKIDEHAHISNRTEIDKIKALSNRHILCLMCDSTNAVVPGKQLSEEEIDRNIHTMFTRTRGRMIFGIFSSLLSRAQQILTLAEKYNKKVLIEGFSLKTNIEIGRQLGYIRVKPNTIITWEEAKHLPKERLLIMCTGAQGEDNAVLMRIANREHKYLRIERDDLVVFSSSVVPGNERSVQRLKDGLYREGADLIDNKMFDIHAGGHAKADDLIQLIKWVRPKFVMPIEGNYSFLIANRRNAVAAGVPEKNVLVADNGQAVEFHQGQGYVTNHRVPVEYVFVDGLGIGDINHIVLRDRKQLAGDGMVIVVAQIHRTGKPGKVDIISRGLTLMQEQGRLIGEMTATVKKSLKDREPKMRPMEKELRERVRHDLEKFIFQKTHRQPLVIPVIMEV